MQKIIILDFGSQTTQLIGRRIRELDTFCEILPYNAFPADDPDIIGVILSGSPLSVYADDAFRPDLSGIVGKYPVLGICYGAQLLSYTYGGKVEQAGTREYGHASLGYIDTDCPIFKGFDKDSQVWMSHGDSITAIPQGYRVTASTDSVRYAAFENAGQRVWGVQFHPEVVHSLQGKLLLENFVVGICGSRREWTSDSFIEKTVDELKSELGNDKVVLGLSGGVDSSVAAVLLNKAIGRNLTCIFVNHGLLRKNEFTDVLNDYVFIQVFDAEASRIEDAKWLAQGTIYPDRIESLNITGKTIKSHHNVGGLPEKMGLKLCEPLKWLFKDEVRAIGRRLGIPEHLIGRHPFPGPGLAVRIIGEITPEKVTVLQEADAIFINGLREWKLYDRIWQAGAILLADRTVGVMGDERTFDNAVALRAVTSVDAMTADWAELPYDFMHWVSNEIINKVKGVNRVCYDISSKPPATIEWE